MASRLLFLPRVAVLLTLGACTDSAGDGGSADDHPAETFAVGSLPAALDDATYDDADVGAFAYKTCERAHRKFLDTDESLTMRTLWSWAWFRPSQDAWAEGARWYSCDVVGGNEDPYPGDRLVEVISRDHCGNSVSAWLECRLQYKFAHTWFHEAEWKTGNRRSICWAWTTG